MFQSLCDGTRNFDQDRDQGRDQKYKGTGTGSKDQDQLLSWTGTWTVTGAMTKIGTRTCKNKKHKNCIGNIF